MNLFSRKPQAPAAPAPVLRIRRGVTCGELNAAIAAISAVMAADCSTRKTLDALLVLTDDAADDIVRLNGPAPVTMESLDAAIAEVQGLGLSAGTLSPLNRVRALLAQAAEKAAKVGSVPVTRAEFDALVEAVAIVVSNIDAAHDRLGYADGKLSYRLERIIKSSDELKISSATYSMLQLITGQVSIANENSGAHEMRCAGAWLNVVPGGNGRNF
jgi:hypothetical protein